MTKQKWLWLFQCLLIVLLLTGCWDTVEIEDRGFVVGAAVDLPGNSAVDENAVMVTNQFVVPSGMGAPSQGGDGQTEAYNNLTVTGKSVFAIQREMSTIASRSPYLPHMQIIAISRELAETKLFEGVMDLFIRDHEMRRGVSIIIAEGGAKQLLEKNPKNEQLPVMHIQSVIENNERSATVIEPLRLGELHEYILNKNSYIVPRMVKNGNELNYEGASVFHGHNNRMAGTLTSAETKGYNLITGELASGKINVTIEDQPVTLEIINTNSSIAISDKTKANIGVSVDTKVETRISETFATESMTSETKLRDIEKKAKSKMEKLMNQTINKVQGELNADVLGVNRILKQRHYDLWKDIRENWDSGQNYFADSSINVTANVQVQSSGAAD